MSLNIGGIGPKRGSGGYRKSDMLKSRCAPDCADGTLQSVVVPWEEDLIPLSDGSSGNNLLSRLGGIVKGAG